MALLRAHHQNLDGSKFEVSQARAMYNTAFQLLSAKPFWFYLLGGAASIVGVGAVSMTHLPSESVNISMTLDPMILWSKSVRIRLRMVPISLQNFCKVGARSFLRTFMRKMNRDRVS